MIILSYKFLENCFTDDVAYVKVGATSIKSTTSFKNKLTAPNHDHAIFHADTGANCPLVTNKAFLQNFVSERSPVDVTGEDQAFTEGYGRLDYYFKSVGPS